MPLKRPESMQECVYYTRRAVGKGQVMAWVFRGLCPACNKAMMGKPTKPDGSPKVRASEYVCPACGHAVEKEAYERTLTINIVYTCPECGHAGECSQPYVRKSFQGVKAVVFICESCNANIPITKKLKAPKAKKSPIEDLD